jgi:hypothetical protein
MYCNKAVIIVTIMGLLSTCVIFMFDPTHDYPTIQIEVELDPGEETKIDVPTSTMGFMQWAGILIGNPYLWVASDTAKLELVEFARQVFPGIQIGLPVSNKTESGTTVIRNTGNETIVAHLNFTMAPTPSDLGSAKTWWYIILGLLETLISGGIAIIKPGSQTITRQAAPGSLAASRISSTQTSDSTCSSCLSCSPCTSCFSSVRNFFSGCCKKKKTDAYVGEEGQ